MDFGSYFQSRRHRIEAFLEESLLFDPDSRIQETSLIQAIQYSVLNGGKRIRPLLVYATGEALGCPLEHLDAAAAAVEFIHCYSLIHDDLPAMDNDDLRRGQPSCHKKFDEATAILAGDALQTLAFQILCNPHLNPVSPEQQVLMLRTLTEKCGVEGLIGGQALDLFSQGRQSVLTLDHLRTLHQKKTGALMEASVLLAAHARAKPLEEHSLLKLQEYARCIGLAFQIQDDILDITTQTATLGKTSGKDIEQQKATFPSKLGLERSKDYAEALHLQALDAIAFLDERGSALAELSDLFISRVT